MSSADPTVGAIALDALDVALAGGLVLVAGVVSVALRLGLMKKIALASVRTVVQLLLLGWILEWVFDLDAPLPVTAVAAFMVLAAGHAAARRVDRTFGGATADAILTLLLVGTVTTAVVTGAVIGVEPWFDPQYLLPILGMILGNTLTGVSLCLDAFLLALGERGAIIEADLALGATRWEAARRPLAAAVRRGMIPILNSMTVVGLVSLPGMMTGQILAGADPLDAVLYQIVVMFMLCASCALGALGVAGLAFRRLFDEAHRLRAERIGRW